METKIITFANHKGGVGKTTTAACVGSVLASKGKKTLLIDLDAQANLTISLYPGDTETLSQTVYDSLSKGVSLPIVPIAENLSLVPASLNLAMADIELCQRMCRETILKSLIDPIKGNYDFILIDCPPSLGLLTLNAFVTSNEIIIPLKAEVLPYKGLETVFNFLKPVQQQLNSQAHITGILITQKEGRAKLPSMLESGLREQQAIHVFDTVIRKNIRLAEAPAEKKSIIEYDPECNGAKDYATFTDELLTYLGL